MKQPITLVDTQREGWMHFRRMEPNKKMKWKRYWFALGRQSLRYYQRERDMEPKGELMLQGAMIIDLDLSNPVVLPSTVRRDCVLQLWKGRDLPYLIAAPTPSDKFRWIKALQSAVENILMDEEHPRSPAGGDPAAAGGAAVGAGAGAAPSGGAAAGGGENAEDPANRGGGGGPADDDAAANGRAYSVSGEQLVLTYRYMKERVEAQGVPRILYMPDGKVYRRFGLRLGIAKLLKKYPSIDTLCFEDCMFAADFFVEFSEALQLLPAIRSVVFRSDGKSPLQDQIPLLVRWMPSSVLSLSFENVLTRRGVVMLLDNLSTARAASATAIAQDGSDAVASAAPAAGSTATQTAGVQSVAGASGSGMAPAGATGPGAERIVASQLSGLSLVGHPLRAATLDRLVALGGFLVTLNLSMSSLGDDGATVLLDGLADSTYLAALSLADNRITKISVDTIVHFLATNSSLTSLDLSSNRIADGAADIFVLLAGFHQRLRELNLLGNRIGHLSVFSLIKMLQQNASLRSLNLDRNKFREDSGHMIASVFPQNVTLTFFRIGGPKGAGAQTLAPSDLQLFQRVCYRNDEALRKVRNVERQSVATTWAELKCDHERLLRRMLYLCGVSWKDWQDIRESAEFERCNTFVGVLIDNYSDRLVEDFVNDGDFRDVIGLNGGFFRHVSFLFYLSERMLARHRDTAQRSSSVSTSSGGVPDNVLKEGYIYKRGGRRHNWKRRWFVLSDTMVTYYMAQDNRKRKGSIPLDQAVVREGTRGVTTHTFEIVTPNRTYVLSCDSQKEMEEWICAIGEARDGVGAGVTAAAVQLEEVIAAVHNFCRLYENHRVHLDDPHRKWVFQFWIPVCLETLYLYYISTSSEQHRQVVQLVRAHFHHSTSVALFMLSGEYLFDYSLLRVLEATRDEAAANSDLEVRALLNDWLESVHTDLSSLLAMHPSSLDETLEHLIEENVVVPHITLESESARLARPPVPAILEKDIVTSEGASGAMYRMLVDLPEHVLSELTRLEKRPVKRPVKSTIGMQFHMVALADDAGASTAPQGAQSDPMATVLAECCYRGVALAERAPQADNFSVFAAELRNMESVRLAGSTVGDRAIDRVVFCLCALPTLQHLREPAVRLLTYTRWLSLRWPVDVIAGGVQLTHLARSHALRLVCVLQLLFRGLSSVPLSITTVNSYELWQRFCRAGEDLVQMLVLGAHYAFPRSSEDCVQVPLRLLFTAAVSALVVLVSSELSSGAIHLTAL